MFFSSKWVKLGAISCLGSAVLLCQQPIVPENTQTGAPVSATNEQATPDIARQPAGSMQNHAAASAPASPQRLPDYVLGPEDQIIIRAFQVPEIPASPIQIGGDGYINLPMAGNVKASGLTVSALEQELSRRFSNYVRDSQVTILVAEYRSQPASILGAVNSPGVVQLRGHKNLAEVIALAGGLQPGAGSTATITRELSEGKLPLPDAVDDPSGQFSVAHVKLRDVMDAKNPERNIAIQANDLIMIPKAPLLYVVGQVAKPGGYVLTDHDTVTVLQAVALAGGLTPLAAAKRAKILHQNGETSERTELPTNVSKILSGQAPDVALHQNDILFVPTSGTKSAGSKTLDAMINMAGAAIWKF